MHTTTTVQVDVSAQLEHRLELLRRHHGLATTTAALEMLLSRQVDRSVYAMTGKRPGPKLAVDNTSHSTTQHNDDNREHREQPQQLSSTGAKEPGCWPFGRPR